MVVLENDSAILGYSKEISRPLYAYHHGVCKYSSPEDANYVSVRNALGALAEEIARKVGLSATRPWMNIERCRGHFLPYLNPTMTSTSMTGFGFRELVNGNCMKMTCLIS